MDRQSKIKWGVGIGGGLVGAFLIFRWWQKRAAEKKLAALMAQAVAGQIPTRQFLDEVMKNGAPDPTTGKVIKLEEAATVRCEQIFPPNIFGNVLPGFAAALEDLKRSGRCL